MSESINFDFMPIFLKSNREKDLEKTFVNTQEKDTDILKQPEFLQDLKKTLNMKKQDTELNKQLAQKEEANKTDREVINDIYNQLKNI